MDAISGTAGNDTTSGVIDFAGGTSAGAASTVNGTDKIVGGSGTDTLKIALQNASAGANIGTAVTAQTQVNTYTFASDPAAGTDTIVVNYGSVTSTITTGATKATAAAALAAAINNAAGAVIAISDGVDKVTVTAPTAGVALPAITFGAATAAADLPTTTFTTANRVASNGSINLGDVTGVEILNVQNISGATANFDADAVGGLTAFNADRSTSNLAVTNLAKDASAGIIGNGSIATGNLSFGYKTASDAAVLNVSGGAKGGAVSITSNPTAVTINSTGATNAIGTVALSAANTATALTINADASLTTGTISGFKAGVTNNTITVKGVASVVPTGQTAAVNIGAIAATVGTVDASGLTAGGISASLGSATANVTGGQGNDTITTNNIVLTTGSVNAGAGTGDRLVVTAAADVAATPAAKYTNFEVLRNVGGGATLDVSKVAGITSIELGATGQGATAMTATQAAAVSNLADNATLTLALADASGAADVLNVTLKNATATTSADLTAATITGFETLNVTSASGTQGNSTPGNDLSFAVAGNLTALNVAGAYDLAIATANITKAVTIASTQTGSAVLNVSGNLVKGSTVTTTANADTITTTAAVAGTTGDFVTYNAGAGNDAITTTLAALNNTSAANASIKIDGGDGVDTVSTDAGTYVDANFQYVTNVEKLTFTGGGALSVTTGGFFDTNFKSAGVTFTDTAWAGATAQSIDATTFTGKVTANITQSDADTGASVVMKSGSANDTIVITTGGALTATTNLVNSNAGDDTVTLNLAALNAAGKFTVNLGAGNDILNANYTGAGLLDVTGGSGADTIALSAGHTAGKMNVIQGIGDSGTFAKPGSNTFSTVGLDVITGALDNDTITLSGNTALVVTTINTGNDLSTATYADQTVTAIRGTYDSVAKTFIGSGAGGDLFVVYDSTAGAATTFETVVLVGQTALTSVSAGGVITI